MLSSPAQHFLPDTTSSVVKTKKKGKKQNKKILNLERKKKQKTVICLSSIYKIYKSKSRPVKTQQSADCVRQRNYLYILFFSF